MLPLREILFLRPTRTAFHGHDWHALEAMLSSSPRIWRAQCHKAGIAGYASQAHVVGSIVFLEQFCHLGHEPGIESSPCFWHQHLYTESSPFTLKKSHGDVIATSFFDYMRERARGRGRERERERRSERQRERGS